MPMPKPKDGMMEDDFMEMCMMDDSMMSEFPDDKQRKAVCKKQWDDNEMKSDTADHEKRSFTFSCNVEKREETKEKVIRGHASVFNQWTDIGGWFQECVAPGAFTKSIGEDDIRALFNHDANHVLGRNKSGTLKLSEDNHGLAIEIDPPDTQFARDLVTLMERGDISQMSFAFQTLKDSWAYEEGQPDKRTLEKVRLFDVSMVTYPAYEGATAALASRSKDKATRDSQGAVSASRLHTFKLRQSLHERRK